MPFTRLDLGLLLPLRVVLEHLPEVPEEGRRLGAQGEVAALRAGARQLLRPPIDLGPTHARGRAKMKRRSEKGKGGGKVGENGPTDSD